MVTSRPGSRASRTRVVAAGLLALAISSARASTQDSLNEKRIASTASISPAGEIDYNFDTALNTTHARYISSLAPTNFFKRLFVSSPVHTVIATYDFGGRVNGAMPDAVRLTLLSDEYKLGTADDLPASLPLPMLIVHVDNSFHYYPLSVGQRTETWSERELLARPGNSQNSNASNANANPGRTGVHVARTATVSIPICEFLALVNGHDVRGTVVDLDFQLREHVLRGLRRFVAEMAPLGASSNGSCSKK